MFENQPNKIQQIRQILRKFLLRIFVFALVAILFTSWLMVGLKQLHFKYAIWISISVVACWVVAMILITLKERNSIEETDSTEKPFAPEEIGMLEIVPRDNDPEISINT